MITRTLGRSPLCDQYPFCFLLGQDRSGERVRSFGRLVTSDQIKKIGHGEADYAYLDAKLGRQHLYEEGIVFIQGFYDTLDSSYDLACEREG